MSLVDCRPCACIVQADGAIAGPCFTLLADSADFVADARYGDHLCVIREPECPVCPGSPRVFEPYRYV